MLFNLLAIIIYLTFYLKFIICTTFIPISIIYCFFPNYITFINIFKNIILSSISFITHMLLFKNIYVDSNELLEEIQTNSFDSNIIISNHILDLDFLIHNIILSNTSLNSINICVSKKSVGYKLPICGYLGSLTGDIFLNRKIEFDIYKLNKKKIFNNLLLFPEGTCFTSEKKTISDNYCNKNKLIKFNYHLYPRTTGIKTIIQSNKNIKYIYDVTLIFDKISHAEYGKNSTAFSYFYNITSFPNKIFIQINKYKIKNNNIEKQIENIYYNKDKFIEGFNCNQNKFIPIKYNYIKGFVCFIATNLLTISSIYFVIKYNFIIYIYVCELLLFYIYFLIYM